MKTIQSTKRTQFVYYLSHVNLYSTYLRQITFRIKYILIIIFLLGVGNIIHGQEIYKADFAQTGTNKHFMPYAVFKELPLGKIKPEGWLRTLLIKQANGITGHQPEFCFPFDRNYWQGNEQGQDKESNNGGTFWYPWEQEGYRIDGAYRCAVLIDDNNLRQQTLIPIRYTISHPIDGWFLGPRVLLSSKNTWPGRWPQAVFFRALAASAEGENDKSIVEAMHRHYLKDTTTYQGGPFGPRERVHIESLLWCYSQTGDAKLLYKALGIWALIPRDELAKMQEDKPSDLHGVSFAELTKLAAILYMYTGYQYFLDFANNEMKRVFKYHMLVSGTPSSTESLAGTKSLNAHEVCDIVEFNYTWGYLLMATGEGNFADRIERGLFNAGMGAIRKDWKGVQYISAPNQVLATRNSCHIGHVGTAAMMYGPNADHRPEYSFVTSCCAGNIARMLPHYTERMWMDDGRGGLAAVLYGPCRVKTTVGLTSEQVEIVEETSYPFSERISFKISSVKSIKFPLHLRVPVWCKSPKLLVNGKDFEIPGLQNGFFTLERTFSPGDEVVLELPMHTSLSHWPDGGIALERGPLVFSLFIKEQWEAIEMPEMEITSSEFPMWSTTAASPWNYALDIDTSSSLEGQIKINEEKFGDDPWSDVPITMKLKGQKVKDWDLVHAKDKEDINREWLFTPPLPNVKTLSTRLSDKEIITMVPYGCTHLRMTIIPNIME